MSLTPRSKDFYAVQFSINETDNLLICVSTEWADIFAGLFYNIFLLVTEYKFDNGYIQSISSPKSYKSIVHNMTYS